MYGNNSLGFDLFIIKFDIGVYNYCVKSLLKKIISGYTYLNIMLNIRVSEYDFIIMVCYLNYLDNIKIRGYENNENKYGEPPLDLRILFDFNEY